MFYHPRYHLRLYGNLLANANPLLIVNTLEVFLASMLSPVVLSQAINARHGLFKEIRVARLRKLTPWLAPRNLAAD
ncbi:hypothetical protein LNQ03_08335 [Klebsiella pneumoniae subsp. pneumoniae]|nr:hypothetical protein [Klebsiella pneumoniae subsp. pneumoniae]